MNNVMTWMAVIKASLVLSAIIARRLVVDRKNLGVLSIREITAATNPMSFDLNDVVEVRASAKSVSLSDGSDLKAKATNKRRTLVPGLKTGARGKLQESRALFYVAIYISPGCA